MPQIMPLSQRGYTTKQKQHLHYTPIEAQQVPKIPIKYILTWYKLGTLWLKPRKQWQTVNLGRNPKKEKRVACGTCKTTNDYRHLIDWLSKTFCCSYISALDYYQVSWRKMCG